MNQPSSAARQEPNHSDQLEGGPGLGKVLACWWRERIRIVVHALASLSVVLVLVGAVFFLRSTQQHSTVVFRLLFKGAEKGLYPNGMQFTPDDIVATPVLEEVYRRNDLAKYCRFEEFKSAFAVISINPAIERLRRSFASQLEDRKLSPIDRQKLETEYENRMKSLQNGEFTLVFQQVGAMASWPTTLTGKVIDDTLNVWAEQSRSRGVYKFDLSIFSTNILDELSGSAYDYSVYLDRIRLSIDRILGNLDLLAQIPGARLVRVGEKQVSLGEMDAALRDQLNFELREISAIIYSFGLFREPVLTEAYLREQLFRLDLEQKEILARNEGMKRILDGYGSRTTSGQSTAGTTAASGTLMPQLSDGFLDRIIEMSGQGTENKFRQDISQKIIDNERQMYSIDRERQIYLRSLESMSNTARVTGPGDIKQVVDQRISALLGRLRSSLQNVALLHAELSNRNLQPSLVFTVVEPIQQVSSSSVRLSRLAVPLGLAWMAYLGLVLAGLARRLL